MTAKKPAPAKRLALEEKKPRPAKKPAPLHPLMINRKDWNRPDVMNYICEQIATTTRSLRSIVASGFNGHKLPAIQVVLRWLAEDAALCDQYTHAREAQADVMAEELSEIHEKAWVPVLDIDGKPVIVNGEVLKVVDKSSAMAVRIEADNKKWLMSKLKPKKYGEKLDLTHSGEIKLTDEQLNNRLSYLLGKAGIAAPPGGTDKAV